MVKFKQWTILEACLLLHNVFYLDLDTSTKLTEISVHDTFCYVTKDKKNWVSYFCGKFTCGV